MNENYLVGEGNRKRKKRNSRFRELHACAKAWRRAWHTHRMVRSSIWKESGV